MAMNINSALTYSAYQGNVKSNEVKEKKEAQGAGKIKESEAYVTKAEKELSESAQELLEKLRSSRKDMDFMVADCEKGKHLKELLGRGAKEFTVIFSSEELEKMASDEKYYEEKMKSLDGAVRMSEEINAKFGFESAFGKANNVEITKFGISFNSDGTTTLFAELEKSSAKQKERIEQAKEKKTTEEKEAEKQDNAKKNVKRFTVFADTKEELFEKIGTIDWNSVKVDPRTVGTRFDYSI